MKLTIQGLNKSYGGKMLFEGLNLEMSAPDIYCLMGISGWGKTTFLRIVMGLEQPDGGQVLWQSSRPLLSSASTLPKMGCVFQEDRLCERFSAVENVAMVLNRKLHWVTRMEKARNHLLAVLDKDSLDKPVSRLSGGMRRRVAIVRAMASDADVIFMDEPFTGLDASTRQQVIEYILQKQDDRLMLIVTHQAQDAQLLGARTIQMETCKTM